MAILATVPFTGTDGTDVAGFTNQAGTLKYQSNQGALLPAAAGYSPMTSVYTAIPVRANGEAYVEFVVPNTEFYFTLQARTTNSPSGYNPKGYSVNFTPDPGYQLNWCALTDDTPTNLFYGAFEPVAGDRWAVRLKVTDTSIQSKAWALSGEFVQTEPSQWDYSEDDANISAAGYFGFYAIVPDGVTPILVDNLAIYDAAGPPVTAPSGGFNSMLPFFGRTHKTPLRGSGDVPVGDYIRNGRRFSPIVIEDFNTDADLGFIRQVYPNMGYYNGNLDTSNNGTYDPDGVLSVSDSILDFYLRTAIPSTGAQASGAGSSERPLVATVMPDNYTPITYGRAALRYRVVQVTGPGYKFVPLMFPIDNDWNKGEIDWVEFDINPDSMVTRPANAVPGTLGQGPGGIPLFEPSGIAMYAPDTASDWHTGAVEWTPDGVFFYHDDFLLAQLRPSAAPTTPVRATIQAETWINQGPTPAESEAHIQIDWIATYHMV